MSGVERETSRRCVPSGYPPRYQRDTCAELDWRVMAAYFRRQGAKNCILANGHIVGWAGAVLSPLNHKSTHDAHNKSNHVTLPQVIGFIDWADAVLSLLPATMHVPVAQVRLIMVAAVTLEVLVLVAVEVVRST